MPIITPSTTFPKVQRKRGSNLVQDTAQVLREQIFAVPSGTFIGALHELARNLEVGIVTLQQAARVLEHEGLLEVRRGPGGGYYAARPDDAALERAFDAYLRVHPSTWEEALDMTSLLFNELAAAAAQCRDKDLFADLRVMADQIETAITDSDLGAFEFAFQELLFRMVRRPLFEMLTRVTLQYAASRIDTPITVIEDNASSWRAGRRRIIAAILDHDPALARFEANRSNRELVLRHITTARA